MIKRRAFIKHSSTLLATAVLPFNKITLETIVKTNHYDVIIIGGSYSGLAAAMALGRALMRVLVIDGQNPCNKQTPYSHNFLTQDGVPPLSIAHSARQQAEKYPTVTFTHDLAISGAKSKNIFEIGTKIGEIYTANKLIFATGIRDQLPEIAGLSACWGISVLHCPYCHGYEVKNQPTAIIANANAGFDLVKLLSNWSKELTLLTDGPSALSEEQTEILMSKNVTIIEKQIAEIKHEAGYASAIQFMDGGAIEVGAIYIKAPFEQSSPLPGMMGCEVNPDGYLVTNSSHETSINGIYACGDNSSRVRTVANAVATGTFAGMSASKALIFERFNKK